MKMYLPPPGQKSSRRSVLKKGLFGGVLLALGGGWLYTRATADVPLPTEGLRVLSPREYATIMALVQRFHPRRPGFPDAQVLNVAFVCDRILDQADATAQTELKQLLMLFENALPAFLFGLRIRPFTQLPAHEQDTVLGEWATSRVTLRRTGFVALRTLVMAGYYSQTETWSATGYGGPLPGLHDASAHVWKGGGEPRLFGNGVWIEPPPAPVPEETP